MKKKILIGVGVLAAVVVIGLIVVYIQLDSIVKTGIETIGPEATGTTVTVDSVSVSPFSMDASLEGIHVGNPEGYKSDFAMKLNKIAVDVDQGSVGGDVVKINNITVDGAEVNWDGLKGSNLMDIKANVLKFAGMDSEEDAPAEPEEGSDEIMVFIKEFNFTNGKLHVWIKGKKILSLPIPSLKLTNIGDEEKGVTIGGAIAEIIPQLFKNFGKIVTDNLAGIQDAAGDLWEGGKKIIDKGTSGIKKLFGKDKD